MSNIENRRQYRIRKRMYKKQKGLCWICGERMSISLSQASKPHYASFDHLLPKADGGSNAQTNLKLAHAKCNSLRDRIPLELVVTLQTAVTANMQAAVTENESQICK